MRLALMVFLTVFYSISVAQQSDLGLWTAISIEKNITKDLSYSVSEEIRFFNNIGSLGTVFTDAGLNYKFNKYFRASINYRFAMKLEPGMISNRSRYYLDLSARKKFGRVMAIDRIRLQSQFNDYFTSDNGRSPYYYLRNLLLFKLDLDKKYTPYLGGEVFYQLNNPEGNMIDNIRLRTGVNYDINKNNSIDLGFIFQKEINKRNPLTSYIPTVSYSYVF